MDINEPYKCILSIQTHTHPHTHTPTNPHTHTLNLLSFLLRCSTRPHEWGTQ